MSNSTISLRKKLQENLRGKKVDRAIALQRAETDLDFRSALIEKARRDPVFFFNQFLWTYDPRQEAKPHHFPFFTYEHEENYLRELEAAYQESRDLLTDKSREMGVTWTVLGWILWHWLFDKSFNALIGSEKEPKCDNWELDSHFGKLEYLIKRLPWWILPEGFDLVKDRTFLNISNPANGNSIQGDSANRQFSRQGRYSVIFLDEFAFWEWAASVWTATADASPVRIVVSTPYGKNNKFAQLRFGGGIRVVTLHWKLHPLKDLAWYEFEKSRRSPREVAQELDIDYEASGSEKVFTIKTDKDLYLNVFIDPFDVPNRWEKRACLDYGTRNVSSFHAWAMDYDEGHYAIWEWRRNMADLRAEGFKGSMVKAIAGTIFNCPYIEQIDSVWADPSLWVKDQNTNEGMTSIILQIIEALEEFNREWVKDGNQPKELPGFCEGAQSDLAAIEVVESLWEDPLQPKLKIFKNCGGLMTELEDLLWEDWSEMQQQKRSKREKIMNKNNHSWDGLKYYILSRHYGPERPQKTGMDNLEAAEAQADRDEARDSDHWN